MTKINKNLNIEENKENKIKKHYHFIGIGGAGMSGLAKLLKEMGHKITGSDSSETKNTKDLRKKGIEINIGENEKLLNKNTEIIYTDAIDKSENTEYKKSLKLNLKPKSYFETLGEISKQFEKVICVAGTSGKTSTTSMLGVLFNELGMEPNMIIGANVPNFDNSNFLKGKEKGYLILEACEHMEHFLYFKPNGIIFTNIGVDHLDFYKNKENYEKAFETFSSQIKDNGHLILTKEDFGKVKGSVKPCTKVGKNKNFYNEEHHGKLDLIVPGKHMQKNAIKAMEMVYNILEKEGKILTGKKELKKKMVKILNEKWQSTERRFEKLEEKNENILISDYAHAGPEVEAVLKGVKEKYGKDYKITVIFQPHMISRTEDFKESFEKSLKKYGNEIYLLDIFKARKEKTSDAKAKKLIKEISKNIGKKSTYLNTFKKSFEKISEKMNEKNGKNIVIIMGAGDLDGKVRVFLTS